MELKTARLTILIDPGKKQAFEELCRTQDMTPSQVVRRLIRDFMEQEQAQAPRRTPARKAVVARRTR
jgi:predicted transcriptional regulator